jgi:hypothetical protein
VPPSCLSDRKHRRRPRGLYYYYYYYYIVYKRSSSYISPISISYRNRTPRVTLIIVMYYIYARTLHIICAQYVIAITATVTLAVVRRQSVRIKSDFFFFAFASVRQTAAVAERTVHTHTHTLQTRSPYTYLCII